MYCTGCGSFNEDSSSFCTHCGRPLAKRTKESSGVTRLDQFKRKNVDREQDGTTKGKEDGSPDYPNDSIKSFGNTQTVPQKLDPIVPKKRIIDSDYYTHTSLSSGINPLYIMVAILAIAVVVTFIIVNPGGVLGGRRGTSPNGVVVQDEKTIGTITGDTSNEIGSNRASKGQSSIIGNLINGGHMTKGSDGYIYFANPTDGTDWNTRSIVRCSEDGSGKKTVYSGPNGTQNLYHLSVIDGRVVFNQVEEHNSKVISVRTDGGDKIELDSCDDWSLCQVDDGWVYYLKNGRIYRCDLSGNSRTSLENVAGSSLWRVSGDKLYTFSEKGAREILVSDLDGKNRKTAYAASHGYEIRNAFPIDTNTLLVWETPSSGSGTKISRVDTQSGSSKSIWTSQSNIERMCSYSDGIVITKADTGSAYSIATIPYDSGNIASDVVVTHDAQARYTCCVANQIFYGVVDANNGNNCSVWTISLSDSNPHELG